jgi:hypothetical protein
VASTGLKVLCFLRASCNLVSADSKGVKGICFDTDSWVRGSVDSKEDSVNVGRPERRNVKGRRNPPPPPGGSLHECQNKGVVEKAVWKLFENKGRSSRGSAQRRFAVCSLLEGYPLRCDENSA